jgi:hypothetical protein
MRSFRTVILLAVPVLAGGCLPTTPEEAGLGVVLLGFGFVVPGLGFSVALFTAPKGRRAAAWIIFGAFFLIGGGLIALGGWWASWWGQ